MVVVVVLGDLAGVLGVGVGLDWFAVMPTCLSVMFLGGGRRAQR